MYIDEKIAQILTTLNTIMIPASETEKMQAVKNELQATALKVRQTREQAVKAAQEQAEQAKEEKTDEA